MQMSIAELRRQLSDIEPSDSTYRGIDPSDVPVLRELLDDEEAWLAARAVHALSRIDSDAARDALLQATGSSRAEVRVAVAASAPALPPSASDPILSRLLGDPHPGVQKFAIRSASPSNSEAVKRRVAEIATTSADTAVARFAAQKSESRRE